ncbi:MAG: dienelactone hydrolase family protein [Gammaproteobacteria bacterium]
MLDSVEIEPRDSAATASVIWLHGLGADGHDFEPVVPHLGLPANLAVRFVFPHAPAIPVTINDGYVMPAWYDILEMDLGRRVDEAQLRASAQAVGELIARENARGVPSERIVLAGFSQGGAVGYELALTWPQRLAGLIAISTYFATRPSITPHPASAGMPILVCHGRHDTLVPAQLGRDAVSALSALGYAVEYRDYAVEHGIDMEEIRDIGAWLAAALA